MGPTPPAGIEPFDIPPRFARWWELVQACSGRAGDLAAVQWFIVPDAREFTVGGRAYQGYTWNAPTTMVVLAERFALDGQLVRHEMLHALGVKDHPAEFFRDRCGGIVACNGECARAVDEPYAPNSPASIVTPDVLDVELALWPSQPSVSADSGWTTLVISARNPRSEPIRVRLQPASPGSSATVTFGYYELAPDQSHPNGWAYAYQGTDYVAFRPHETRRLSVDQRFFTSGTRLRAFFNTQLAPDVTIELLP
jgi:hypothetical protein